MVTHRPKGRSHVQEVLPGRKFRLPASVGLLCNTLTVVLAVVALVFYDFPAVMPVTAGNMSKLPGLKLWPESVMTDYVPPDYACAVLGIMGILALANWILYARGRYRGPRISA